MKITVSTVLTFALVLSLGLNIYEILKTFPHCDDTGRYPDKESFYGGVAVSESWAQEHVDTYREAHSRDETIYKTTGFMLSKKVFDIIFDEPTKNTLTVDIVENDSHELSIVVRGVTTDSTAIDRGSGSSIFLNQTMCPNDCPQYR
jgi:hypothetical protein